MTGVPTEPRLFFRWLVGLAEAGDPRLRPLGPIDEAMAAGIDDLAKRVRRSVWHMTHTPTWAEVRSARRVAELGRRPGLDGRYVTSPRSLERLPLLSSHHRGMRLAPVIAPLLVVDASVMFSGIPRGHDLTGVWTSQVPHVVSAAVSCFDQVWADSVPAVPEGQSPPFTPRMVEIGFLLTDGASDREIARALHVSERTVSAEVGQMIRRLGARSRAHAIALIGTGSF